MSKKTYDSKCYDLAEVFLSDVPEMDTPKHRDELATEIQTAIESYISSHTPYPSR